MVDFCTGQADAALSEPEGWHVKCDRCDREATTEEVTKVGDTYVYKHLCEACAAGEGIDAGGGDSSAPRPKPVTPKASACAGCGLTFVQFRESGRVGCPACYEAFESRLGPMIERAQEGGTHHVGKSPKRLIGALSDAGADRAAQLAKIEGSSKAKLAKLDVLSRQLRAALDGERFEQAAIIRDEMRRLRETTVQSGEAEPGAPAAGSAEPGGDGLGD